MKRKRRPWRSRYRRDKFPPCVRVVRNNATGKLRALWHNEDGPRAGETWVGIGSDLLKIDGCAAPERLK